MRGSRTRCVGDHRREQSAGDRALLARERARRPRVRAARRGDRRPRARAAATARCSRFARRFDGVTAAARGVAPTRCATARRACRRTCGAPSRRPRATSRAVAARQIPKHWRRRGRARRVGRAARRAARARRLLRARRPLSAALVAADDRRSGARRRRPRDHRRVPAARAGRDGGGARGRRHAAVPDRRRARDCGAGLRHGDDAARGQDRRARATATSRRPRRCVAADCAIDFYAGPDRDRHRRRRAAAPTGSPPISSRRPSTIPTRASIFITWSRALADARGRRPSRAARAGRDIVEALARGATARIVVTRDGRRSDGAGQPHRARASGRRSRGAGAAADRRPAPCSSARSRRRRPATTRPDRTTCCRPRARRDFAAGCSAADFVRVMSVQRVTRAGPRAAGADDPAARARRRAEAHAESIEIRLNRTARRRQR